MAVINGNNFANVLNGTADAFDFFRGFGGADLLNANWSLGTDIMRGGDGNDTYRVNSAGDQVIEAGNVGSGIDTVQSRVVAYNLTANVENLNLDLGAAFGGGNALANTIRGNALNNTLHGRDGNDWLFGNGGNDVLVGGNGIDRLYGGDGNDRMFGNDGADFMFGGNGNDSMYGGAGNDVMLGNNGNDLLDGGTGADVMNGGLGNDRYYVDNNGDNVVEGAAVGSGTDTVYAAINEWLQANVENLTLLNTAAALLGNGNGLNNTIVGNANNNFLNGFDGNDTIYGRDGHDRMSGGNGGDRLFGGNGIDRIVGGAGTDRVNGGAGTDEFVLTHRGIGNRDIIEDFNHADDTIALSNVLDAGLVGAISPGIKGLNFGGNVIGNTLSAGWFFKDQPITLSGIYVFGSGSIVYNATNGLNGDEVMIAQVDSAAVASIDRTDFIYVA